MPTFPTFCGKDCGGDACPLLADVADGAVTRVYNNPAGGRWIKACRRGYDLREQSYAPGRLTVPLIRSGERGSGQFRQASWDEALALTAQRLAEIRAKYGPQAVLNLAAAGSTSALNRSSALLGRFLSLFGGYTRLTGSYSNGAASFVLPYLLGGSAARQTGFDAATLQYSQMIILWGANILDTRQGAEFPARVLEAKTHGASVVVIDPRRTATVQHACTWWLPIRPGTDAALMLAVLYVWIQEHLLDRPFVAAHSVGFEQLEGYVLGLDGGEPRSPKWAAPICALPAEEIACFARAYAAAKPAALLPGYSIQRVFAGEESYRLSVALQVASGNFGMLGGSTGAINSRLPAPRLGQMTPPPAPAQPNPALPVVRWPDAVLQGRAGGYPSDIRAAYVLGSNFINQGADARRSIAAFAKFDFSVCNELYLTPTARWCDVIFPAAAPLEVEDIGLPWAGNYLLYKPQVILPPGQARCDYDILWALAEQLGFGQAFSEGRTAHEWIEHFIAGSDIPDPQEFRRTGVYLAPDQERVGLSEFSADPSGHPLDTPSGLVEIASRRYQQETGFPAIPTWQAPPGDPRYPLLLISPKSPHYTHSQGSPLPRVSARAGHALSLHPQDAAARGITNGMRVRVYNQTGATLVTARLSDDLTPGVVSLPEGIWLELDAQGVDQAGSVNALTSTEGTAPGRGCIMHAVGVQVEAE